MGSRGYMLELYRSNKQGIERKLDIYDLLIYFVFGEYTSTYAIYSNHKKQDRVISYKNVHKKVRRLFSLGLIKVAKRSQKHGAIFYRLSTLGIFYLLSFRYKIFSISYLVKNYGGDELLKLCIYPYFERSTLEAIQHNHVAHLILEYLADCCEHIESNLRNARELEAKKFSKHFIFDWDKVPGLESGQLIEYLKVIHSLDWLNEETIIEKKDNTVIKISSVGNAGNTVWIKLNQDKTLAVLSNANTELFVFYVRTRNRKSNSNLYGLKVYDVRQETPEAYLSSRENSLQQNILHEAEKFVFSITCEFSEISDPAITSDLKLLGGDSKTLKLFNSTYSNFETYRKKFLTGIQSLA
jgi:hypothetical protein